MSIEPTQNVLFGVPLDWDVAAMSGTAKRVTPALHLAGSLFGASWQVAWANTANVLGAFEVEESNDAVTWIAAGITSPTVNNAAGSALVQRSTTAAYVRLVYANTSGTGTLGAVVAQGKQLTRDQLNALGSGDLLPLLLTAPTAAQKAGLAAAPVAPSATNPFLTAFSPLFTPATPFAFSVARNTSQIIVPAAPAGYVNVVAPLYLMNPDAANATSIVVLDGSAVYYRNVAFGASAAVNLTSIVTSSAVTLQVTTVATGTAMTVIGSYFIVPDSALMSWRYAVTSTWTSIPALTPAAGKLHRPMSTNYGVLATSIMNDDAASTTIKMRLVRGGVTYNIGIAGVTVGAGVRSTGNPFGTFPILMAGDDLQAQCAVAPGTPGAVIVSGACCITDIAA